MELNQLPIFKLIEVARNNLAIAIPIVLVVLAAVILYYVAMVRSVIEMLRLEANNVLLVFAFLALFPFPLVILAGVTILVIWRYHRRDLLERAGGGSR